MRRPRVFKDRSNPLEDLDEGEVFRRYRFKPPTIIYILEQIIPVSLQRPTQRNSPLPPSSAASSVSSFFGDRVDASADLGQPESFKNYSRALYPRCCRTDQSTGIPAY